MVSERYFFAMVYSPGKSAANLAGLLRYLARLSEPESAQGGLTPAQWSALRYFVQANRFSRTVSAFAAYNVTSRGTASQTIKALEASGYLTRIPRPEDGRSARIEVTEAGEAKLAEDPARILVRAIESLPEGARRGLEANLEQLLAGVGPEAGKNRFGTCPDCAHLEYCPAVEGGEPGYYCYWAGEYLERGETDALCVTFTPRSSPGSSGQA